MKYLKLFEDFNSRNPKQVAELLEDLFVEIFDKWEIKEIPDDIEDGPFFANLDTEDPYYNITTIELGKGARVILKIQQNIFQSSSIERFKEMVRDCQPVLSRLKSFGVDFEWNSQMMQNPNNFGRLEYFRVVVELPNKVSESYHNDEISNDKSLFESLKSKFEDIEDCALELTDMSYGFYIDEIKDDKDIKFIRWVGNTQDEYAFYASGKLISGNISVKNLRINYEDKPVEKLDKYRGKNSNLLREILKNFKLVISKLKSHIFNYECIIQFFVNAYGVESGTCIAVGISVEKTSNSSKKKLFEKKFNESQDDEVCKYINDDEYAYWRDKIVGAPHYKAIEIIKKQIAIVESDFSKEFDESKFVIRKDRVTYNGNPIYSSRHTDTELKMAVSYCGDDWYLVECYHNWYFYTFLCDDFIGLESLGQTIIDEIEK